MALNRTRLADIAYVASSAGSIYSNGASTKTYIRGFVFHNTNTTPEVVQLHNVPDSGGSLGTAGNGNKFAHLTLTANETLCFDLEYPIVLIDTNDSIQALTTTASKVTVQVLGDKDV